MRTINSWWTYECLSFVGRGILIYFHSKKTQMPNTSNLFYFGTKPYMFRKVYHSITQQPQNRYDIYLMLYVQSYNPDDGRRDRPKQSERLLYQNKINLRYCASGSFCYRNYERFFQEWSIWFNFNVLIFIF
jgi:hypothetical protein